MEKYNKFISVLERILEVIIYIIFAMMILSLTLQIVARYIFKFGFSWTEELARYGLVWIVFLGAALIHVKGGKHMSMNVLEEVMGKTGKHILAIISELTMLVFCALILYFGIRALPAATKVLTPGLKIAKAVPYIVFPFSGGVMVLASIKRIIALFAPSDKNEGV